MVMTGSNHTKGILGTSAELCMARGTGDDITPREDLSVPDLPLQNSHTQNSLDQTPWECLKAAGDSKIDTHMKDLSQMYL